MAAAEKAFAGISYAALAEVSEQWPIVGRGDMYYGGTSYENTQGLGVQMGAGAALTASTRTPSSTLTPPPLSLKGRGELRAVPVTKLYDMGTTVTPSTLITNHIGMPSVVVHPAVAAKLGIERGGSARVSLNGVEADVSVSFDASLAENIVLVYRSFGIPISEPAAVSLSVAEKA